MVHKLAGLGLTLDQIAAYFDISPSLLDQRLKKDEKLRQFHNNGMAEAIEKVAKVAFNMAVSGEHPAMTMFWLKTRARWHETVRVEKFDKPLEQLITESFKSPLETAAIKNSDNNEVVDIDPDVHQTVE